MFVIVYHNEHAFDNACMEEVQGPFVDRPAALAGLHALAKLTGDPLWTVNEESGYFGAEYEALEAAERDTDMSSEVWAEIVELTASADNSLPKGGTGTERVR